VTVGVSLETTRSKHVEASFSVRAKQRFNASAAPTRRDDAAAEVIDEKRVMSRFLGNKLSTSSQGEKGILGHACGG
jgi:hypothetical protein